MQEAGVLLPNLSLPSLTKILARGAKPIGGFGLVGPPFTNRYHRRDLSLNQPQEAFTNHYHRTGGEGGQESDLAASGRVVRWLGKVARVIIA